MQSLLIIRYQDNYIRSDCDLRRLQQLLGHSNIQTTTIYLQFKDSDLVKAYNRVEW